MGIIACMLMYSKFMLKKTQAFYKNLSVDTSNRKNIDVPDGMRPGWGWAGVLFSTTLKEGWNEDDELH